MAGVREERRENMKRGKGRKIREDWKDAAKKGKRNEWGDCSGDK